MAAVNPFGAPDAAYNVPWIEADEQLPHSAGAYLTVGPADKVSLRSHVRVVYGRRGTGKSHRLKATAAALLDKGDSIVARPETELPPTHLVREISRRAGDKGPEIWHELWTKVILLAGASHILSEARPGPETKRLEASYKRVFKTDGGSLRRTRPYAIAVYILGKYQSPKDLLDFLTRPDWLLLRDELKMNLSWTPPIYMFMDGIDEVEFEDPIGWGSCQQGLLTAVARLATTDGLQRLHPVIAMREGQVNALLAGNNGQKWLGHPIFKELTWRAEGCREFLEEKINRLSNEHLAEPMSQDLVTRWLGISEVYNTDRGVLEPAATYILRHTMLVPRDIVVMGNSVTEALSRLKGGTSDERRQQALRQGVSAAARQVANTAVGIAAVELARSSYLHTEGTSVLSGDRVQDDVRPRLIDMLRGMGNETCPQQKIEELKHRLDAEFGSGSGADTLSSLWRLRVLGVSGGDGPAFYGESEFDGEALPTSDTYVFHPCVLDLCGLRAEPGTRPVYPSRGLSPD